MLRKTICVVGWLFGAVLLAAVQPAAAQFYAQHNLVSDGAVPADITDPARGLLTA